MEVYYPYLAMGVMFIFLLLLREYDKRTLIKRALEDPEMAKKLYEVVQRENARRRLSGSASPVSNPQTQRRSEPSPAKKQSSSLRKSPLAESFERAEKEVKRQKKRVQDEIRSYDE